MGRRIRLLIVALPAIAMGLMVVMMVRGELGTDDRGVVVVAAEEEVAVVDSVASRGEDLVGPDLVEEVVRTSAPQTALASARPYVVEGRVESEIPLSIPPRVLITGLVSGMSLEVVGDDTMTFVAEIPAKIYGGGFEIRVTADEYHDVWVQQCAAGDPGGELFVVAAFEQRLPCLFGTVLGEGGAVADTQVSARSDGYLFVSKTLEDGSFVISGLAKADYSLDVYGLCLLNPVAYSSIRVDEVRRDVDVGRVSVATSGMSFEVVVTLDGVPRSDAVVRWGGRQERTNSQGWVRMETCDATPRYLGCHWFPPGEPGSALHGSRNDVSAANSPLIEIELKRSGLVFEFVDGETGKPVIAGSNVVLTYKGPSANGRNTYREVGSQLRYWSRWDDGKHSFTFTVEGFKEASFELDVVGEEYIGLERFLPVKLWRLE